MARLIQYQRREIEKVIEIPLVSFVIGYGRTYLLNNTVFFLAGLSTGEGTCADLENVNVAVFTTNPRDKNRVIFPDPKKLVMCKGAVLLRDRKENEFNPNVHSSCLQEAVEGLRIFHIIDKSKMIFFRQNGKVALYPKLV